MHDLIQVAPPLPLDKTYTYRIPNGLQSRARPGCRAVVPFGRRVLTGIIVGQEPSTIPAAQIREVLDLPDAEPLLPANLLEFTRWLSEYYFCSWGETLKAALPAGHLQAGSRVVKLSGQIPPADYSPNPTERRILELLRSRSSLSITALNRKFRLGNTLPHLRSLEEAGLVDLHEILPRGGLRILLQEMISIAGSWDSEKAAQEAARLSSRAPGQARILNLLAVASHSWKTSDLLSAAKTSRSTLKALIEAGIVQAQKVEVKRYPTLEALSERDEAPLPEPNAHQAEALSAIADSLQEGAGRAFLLYGVTGSGKTLVYQKAIEHTLELGGTALVLIPEISLTPQMVGRFRAQFPDLVALQHSAMSAGERFDVWRGIRQGNFPIVLGARSAIFAPLANLKLIVVDEEADTSFKQNEPNPRYHARDMALVRARSCGATIILGSATPSVESFLNADRGKFTLLQLPQRIDGMVPPLIRFTTPARIKRKVLGEELERALADRYLRGEQAILLQNRRGFFTFAFCPECSHISRCRHCDVTLALHKAGIPEPRMRCHVCGYQEEPQRKCPNCSGSLRYAGTGTQRVEEELARLMPQEKILRLDLDTTGRKGSHHRILKSFARGQQAVLLGTKMVAHGHDYPNVTLVGVVSADTELAFPDFRCDERAFTLLLQAAGRAGRSRSDQSPAEVLIQTWMPHHPILKLVQAGDYASFYRRDLELRRHLNYPPWGWLVLFGFTALQEARAVSAAQKFLRLAIEHLPKMEWRGPTPAYRLKLKDRHRYQVLLKAPRSARTLQSTTRRKLQEILSQFRSKIPATVQFTIDVDPIQLL